MKKLEHGFELRRFTVFSVVGTLNTAACYALFAALVHWGGWHYHWALAADYAFGILLGYALHRTSTFADRMHVERAFGKYAIAVVATFAANFILLDAIVRAQWLAPLAAQALAMGTVTLGSYWAQKQWVFRSHAQPAAPPPDAGCVGPRSEASARRAA
jgi:putative flippase GtrA